MDNLFSEAFLGEIIEESSKNNKNSINDYETTINCLAKKFKRSIR